MLLALFALATHALYHRRCLYNTAACDFPLTCTFTEIGPCLYRSSYSSISMNVTHASYRYTFADTELVALVYDNDFCAGEPKVENVGRSPKCRWGLGVYVQDSITQDMADGHIVEYRSNIVTRNPRHPCDQQTAIETLYGWCQSLDGVTSVQYSVEIGRAHV